MAVTDTYRPNIDHAEIRKLDPRNIVIAYDRPSDTLVVHFYGRGRPAVSVPSPRDLDRDFLYMRFDPDTDQLVGFEIEDFLDLYVSEHPESLYLLKTADLRGITREEIEAIEQGITPEKWRAAVGPFVGGFVLAND